MNIRRSRLKTGVAVTALLVAVIAAIYIWVPKTNDAALAPPQSVTNAGPDHTTLGVINRSVAATTLNRPSESINYKKEIAASREYWTFAQHVLPAAKTGDADAQFYLYKALSFCTQVNENYFQLNGKPLSLDEGLQYAAKLKLSIGLVQSMYDRCHAFQEHDATTFGNAYDWLDKATKAGQPVAQATTAVEMLQQQLMRNFVKAGAAITPENTAPLIGDGVDPADLMRAAVQSRDPEALINIGWAQALLNLGKDANTEYLAWMLVACGRGLDCSASADWVGTHCSFCDVSSPINLVRSKAGDAWPDVQQRARELSAKLDAGEWNELGIGS